MSKPIEFLISLDKGKEGRASSLGVHEGRGGWVGEEKLRENKAIKIGKCPQDRKGARKTS